MMRALRGRGLACRGMFAGFLCALALAAGCGEHDADFTPPAPTSPSSCDLDRFHGCRAIHSVATGRFHTEQIGGVWWLITPEGNAFFSAGVNHVQSEGDYAPALGRSPYADNIIARYGTEAAWANVVVDRFARLGFTTIGAWSQYELFAGRVPYTIILGFAGRAPAVEGVPAGLTGLRLRDYFAPEFAAGAAAEADGARTCATDPYCVGVFSDNELGWAPGVAQAVSFLDGYLRLPAGAPGKVALQAFFEAQYAGDIAAFNAVWNQQLGSFADVQQLKSLPRNTDSDLPARAADRQAFTGPVAGRYYQVVHDTLRAVSPDLLILGSRLLAYAVPPAVASSCAPFVDVLSANYYAVEASNLALLADQARKFGYIFTGDVFGDLDEIHRLAQRPMLISEFGFRAADAGLPNSYPPFFPTLATQAERTDAYEHYMQHVLARPYMVGAHWFQYTDQPATGRFDGENNNWGIVDIADNEYPELAARMQQVNGRLYQRDRCLDGLAASRPPP